MQPELDLASVQIIDGALRTTFPLQHPTEGDVAQRSARGEQMRIVCVYETEYSFRASVHPPTSVSLMVAVVFFALEVKGVD